MSIPKQYETEIFKSGSFNKGDTVTILDEFVAPNLINPKWQGFLMGKVKFADKEGFFKVNKSSYRLISKAYGEDTKEWIGKNLVCEGEVKMGQMVGRLWKPV